MLGGATSSLSVPNFSSVGESYSYAENGFIATSLSFPTDQLGTQLDPPAHWNEYGATISDVPATVALRPLAVVDITAKVAEHPGYHALVDDVLEWEKRHGRVPRGSVVFFRSDWSRRWHQTPDLSTFPGVALSTLRFLHLNRSILLHGHEPLDTDMTPSLEGEAWLMHHDYLQVEGVTNLHLVPASGSLVSIGFVKVQGGTGGYARLVAICPSTWPHGVSVRMAPAAPLPRQRFPLRRDAQGVLRPQPSATPTQYCTSQTTVPAGCPLPK